MSNQTALTMLQFIGLALPAVAILTSVLFEESPPREPGDQRAANYQNMRLSIVFLLVAGLVDLAYIFVLGRWAVLAIAGGFVGLALLHLTWAILLQKDALEMDHSILWAYRNTYHHLRDWASRRRNMGPGGGGSEPEDEAAHS